MIKMSINTSFKKNMKSASKSKRSRSRRKKQQATTRLDTKTLVKSTRLKIDWDKSVPKPIKKEEPLREMTLEEREIRSQYPNYQEFQTRSDTWQGLGPGKFPGLCFFSSLKKAFQASEQDKTIWKISFHDKEGFSHRLVRQEDGSFKDSSI
jgi:hypothetical protein